MNENVLGCTLWICSAKAYRLKSMGHTITGAQPGCPSFRADTSEVEEQIRFVLENNVEIRLQLCFDVILFHTAACTSINAMVWLT